MSAKTQHGGGGAPRGRLTVLCGAAVLLWVAWWYCRGGDQNLLALAAGLSAVAVALPRAFRGNARWVIWTWLALTVACLAANVERLAPPEAQADESRWIERVVTACFAVGVTALFFRPTAMSVTLIALGGLPVATFVLGKNMRGGFTAGEGDVAFAWSLVVLLGVLDQVQRLTRVRTANQLPPTAWAIATRGVILLGVCGLALALRIPIEQSAVAIQKRIFGLVADAERGSSVRRSLDLSLGRSVPAGFARRMRMLLLVRTGVLPGYLRETVYTTYRSGRWVAPKAGAPVRPVARVMGDEIRSVFPLVQALPETAARYWHVEVLDPPSLTALCLPGSAVSLICDVALFSADTNGVVTAEGGCPERYGLEVVPKSLTASGFPQPDGCVDPAYLAVPRQLDVFVTNWVSACEGLADVRSAAEAVVCVEQYFASNFTYRLGLEFDSASDPLVDFMRRREGSCTQFASAAALMLRNCGLPARVVSGYVCCCWSPWLRCWTVRERDGHAWVELWDRESKGWLVVDPTPPDGHPSAFAPPGRLRMALDWLFASWRRALFGLKNANVLVAIASAGALAIGFLWHMAWSPAGAVVLAGFAAILWLRRSMLRRRRRPSERSRAELAEAMAKLARRSVPSRLRRSTVETWDGWLARVRPSLSAEAFTELSALAEEYQALRYGAALDAAAARDWIRRARRALRREV